MGDNTSKLRSSGVDPRGHVSPYVRSEDSGVKNVNGKPRLVELGVVEKTAAKAERGFLSSIWHGLLGLFGHENTPLQEHAILGGVDLKQLNAARGGRVLPSLSESEFKYLRGVLKNRIQRGELGGLTREELKNDFLTLNKEALFAKYGAANNFVDPLGMKFKQAADGLAKEAAQRVMDFVHGKQGSETDSFWKQSLDAIREEAFEAAKRAPKGEARAVAEAVFNRRLSAQREALTRGFNDALIGFKKNCEEGAIERASELFSEVLSSSLVPLEDDGVRQQLFQDEYKGLMLGLRSALADAGKSYEEGVAETMKVYDRACGGVVPGILDDVLSEVDQYHEAHGAVNLSDEEKKAIEQKAEAVNEQRVETIVVDGDEYTVVADGADERKQAYEEGLSVFEPQDYSEIDVFSGFFEQAELDAEKEIEKAQEKAKREAEQAALAAEREQVRAAQVEKEQAQEKALDDVSVSVGEYFQLGREARAFKQESNRLELEEVKLVAYDDEKQTLVHELEQKRKEPEFNNLSAWMDGFFNERKDQVHAERAAITEEILAVKGDVYDDLAAKRFDGKLSEDEREFLGAIEAKIENLRQKQAVCDQTLSVLDSVRADYEAEISASRYVNPHAGGPEIGSKEWLEQQKTMELERTRAALQVDLPELTNRQLLELKQGLVGLLGEDSIKADDVNRIVDLIDKIPVEKAEAVLSGLLEDVEDKDVIFATLLTNHAFVSLYYGVREEIQHASELSKDRSIDLGNRKDAGQRLLYFTQVSGKLQALCSVLSGDGGTVATKMQAAVKNLSAKETRVKKGFIGSSKEVVTVFKPDLGVRGHLTAMAARARTL